MGGSVGNAFKNPVKTFGDVAGTIVTGGLNKIAPHSVFGRVGGDVSHILTLGQSGAPLTNPLTGEPIFKSAENPYISGPFALDPGQMAGDQAAITNEGNKQYQETLDAIGSNTTAQSKRASDVLAQMMPSIAEDMNSKHLLDSSGYGTEIARQASSLASQVASEEASQKMAALTGRQGFQSGALQRGLSMEDFINQANVAKTIGAQMVPQPPTGKQQFGAAATGAGSLASGVGALAKVGKAAAPAVAAA